MLVAFDQIKHCYVRADQAQRYAQYVCSACQSSVQLKCGENRIAHFAHQNSHACQGSGEVESVTHLMGKYTLWQYFKRRQINVVLEPWLATIQQRPDLLISYQGRRIAIEYQCASISVEQVQRRTAGYRRLGMQVIWLLGPTYQQRRLQAGTLAKFCCLRHGNLQVGFWQKNEITWRIWTDKKNQGQPAQFVKQQLLKLQQQVLQRDGRIKVLQEQLYRQQYHVIGIPLCCHIPIALPAGPKEPVWVITTKLVLLLAQCRCTYKDLQQFILQQPWYVMGVMSATVSKQLWLRCVLRYWLQENMIVLKGPYILLTDKVRWFTDFQTKWAAINTIYHER